MAEEVHGGADIVLCVLFAALTGLVYTIAINVVAVPTYLAEQSGAPLDNKKSALVTSLYTGIYMLSVPVMFCATSKGPVSIVVPVVIASNLLSNMLVQSIVGVTKFSKPARVGTYILSVAAVQLIDVGPTEPKGQVDPVALLEKPMAVAWMMILCGLLVVGALTIPVTKSMGPNNIVKLLAFTALVSIPAAINNSISKVSMALSGPGQAACVVAYFALGNMSTVMSGIGNAGLNNAISVPVFSCVQVMVNGLTGIFIWGDFQRIEKHIAYVMIYFLFCLGIYLSSPSDPIATLAWSRSLKEINLSSGGREESPMGKALQELFWSMEDVSHGKSKRGLARRLRHLLETATEEEVIALRPDMLELTMSLCKLVEDSGMGHKALPALVRDWAQSHWEYYKKYAEQDEQFARNVQRMTFREPLLFRHKSTL